MPVIYEFCIFCNCWTRSKYSMLMLHLMRQRTLRESPKWNLQSARWHCWYLDFGHISFRCSFTTTLPLPTHLINVIIYYVIRHDIQYCMILPTDSVVRSRLIALLSLLFLLFLFDCLFPELLLLAGVEPMLRFLRQWRRCWKRWTTMVSPIADLVKQIRKRKFALDIC